MEAATQLDREEIKAEIRPGTRRDARLCSIQINAAHGQRLTVEERRRAVDTLLNDETWRHCSDRWIAGVAGVDHKSVASRRADLGFPQCSVRHTSDGRVMDISNIGRGRKNEPGIKQANDLLADNVVDCIALADDGDPLQVQPVSPSVQPSVLEMNDKGQSQGGESPRPVVAGKKIEVGSKPPADRPKGPQVIDESIADDIPVRVCPHCGRPIPEEWLIALQRKVAA